jgi:hypothetical protein
VVRLRRAILAEKCGLGLLLGFPSDLTVPANAGQRHPGVAVCCASETDYRKKIRQGPMSFSPPAGFTDEAGTNDQPR